MRNSRWLTPLLPYFAIWAGLYMLHSAWVSLLGFHFSILLILAIAKPKVPVRDLFVTSHYTWIRRSLLTCSAIGVCLYYLHPYLGLAQDLSAQLGQIGLNRTTWPSFLVYLSLTNPLIEEYYWRGYLGSQSTVLHASDMLYAGYHGLVLVHLVHPVMITIALFAITLAGWLWRRMYREDSGLLVPVIGHTAADFAILFTVYLITT